MLILILLLLLSLLVSLLRSKLQEIFIVSICYAPIIIISFIGILLMLLSASQPSYKIFYGFLGFIFFSFGVMNIPKKSTSKLKN